MKHFLQENDFSSKEIKEIFTHAFAYKANRAQRPTNELAGETWGMLFHKKSTRTRVSFEVGIRELGGNPLILDQSSTQIGRGESIEDTVKVLSRFLDGLIIRTHGHDIIEQFASLGSIPVVNALTDFLHPCQIFADCMTILEKTGCCQDPYSLNGKKLTFYGDTQCNMANSWIMAGALFGMKIRLAGPSEFTPNEQILQYLATHDLPTNFEHLTDPIIAARDSDILYTDVWVSMGCEEEAEQRKRMMSPFQVTDAILQASNPVRYLCTACPLTPGKKFLNLFSPPPQAILFDQAENRLHIQKAILRQLTQS